MENKFDPNYWVGLIIIRVAYYSNCYLYLDYLITLSNNKLLAFEKRTVLSKKIL